MLQSDPVNHDFVLPVLQASGMVTSLDDADSQAAGITCTQNDRSKDPCHHVYQQSKSQYNSPWRLGRLLSLVVPPFLAAFILYGWYFASYFIIPYLCSTYPGIICTIYTYTFHSLVAMTTGLFFFIWLLPNTHSKPPLSLPRQLEAKLVPHEVASQEGDHAECWQDSCKGRIIPPRARHCKDCRVCRLEFDHHCPWLGCISRDTFKAFILFLGVATLTIEVGLAPVYPLAWRQFNHVMGLAWQEEWMYTAWWDKLYSWLGGPMYRYIGAIILAYSRYDYETPSDIGTGPTGSVPISPALVFYAILGTILAVFSAILFVNSCKDAAIASSTIEIARISKRRKLGVSGHYAYRYIQMPLPAEGETARNATLAAVREIPAHINLYDFGLAENLKRVFGGSLREYLSPWPPRMEASEHWQLSDEALAYLDIPTERTDANRKYD